MLFASPETLWNEVTGKSAHHPAHMWDASPAMLDKAETPTGTRAPGWLDPFGKELALRAEKARLH